MAAADHRIVCYLDLLGYGQLVSSTPAGGSVREKLESTFGIALAHMEELTLRFLAGNFSEVNKRAIQQISFRLASDSVLATMPFSTEAVARLKKGEVEESVVTIEAFFAAISIFYIYVVTEIAFFFRGGISLGGYYESNPVKKDNLFIFSPALVEAVNLEKAADTPRIVISEEMLALVEKLYPGYALQADNWVFRDFTIDGRACLNIYKFLIEAEDRMRAGGFLRRMRDILNEWLKQSKDEPSRLKKYVWFVNYHNQCIAEYGDPTLKIALEGLF